MTDEKLPEKEVRAFLDILERDYGITPDDLRWFARYRRSVTRYGDWIAKAAVTSVVGSVVAGVVYVLYLGLTQAAATMLKHGGGS